MNLYLEEAIKLNAVTERGSKLKTRRAELKDFLAPADERPPVLHPAMAGQYRLRVQQLHETLQDDSEEKRIEAADVLRTLIEDVILTPADNRDRRSRRSRWYSDAVGKKRKSPPKGRASRE
ncbi:hypothetical protein QE372_005047 [Agrobacterium pusense]|uniref:hypothetical protein n=1 Tax=Agrobacterium pusense TaxID=648995 RepID=UPI00285A332C|nr:hypothetical protein [Agrobacterium pusense]MDR6192713.1 hypothetical protein [Agrobacterium pusense]